jgi:hypothetical protein
MSEDLSWMLEKIRVTQEAIDARNQARLSCRRLLWAQERTGKRLIAIASIPHLVKVKYRKGSSQDQEYSYVP